MRLTASRSELASAASVAARASFSATMAAVGGVLIQPGGDSVLLTCTDGSTTARVIAGCRDSDAGSVLVPARRFADTLRFLDGDEVELETEGDRLKIESGLFHGSLPLMAVGNFPSLEPPSGFEVSVPGPALARAILRVATSASRDESRVLLQGIRVEARTNGFVYLVATDGVRIAAQKLAATPTPDANYDAVFPRDSMADVARAAASAEQVTLLLGDDLTFQIPRLSITSRPLAGGSYPDWRKFIPAGLQRFNTTFDRQHLVEALQRVLPMTEDTTPARFNITPERAGLVVKSTYGEAQDELIPASVSEPYETAFNPTLLLQGLGALEGKQVTLNQAEPLKPASLLGEDDSYVYVQMPMRVVSR